MIKKDFRISESIKIRGKVEIPLIFMIYDSIRSIAS